MPISAEQLATIKAANHAKTKAWEAATFLTGEAVNFAYAGLRPNVIRTEDGTWRCSSTGTIYETLSRWAREKWGGSFDFKNSLFLYNEDGETRRMCVSYMPPVAERATYYPWNRTGTNWRSTVATASASASSQMPATTPAPIKTPEQSAQIETPAAQPAKKLRTYTFDKIKLNLETVITWIDEKGRSNSRRSAAIGELVDWLINHKEIIIGYMLEWPAWHMTLNAIITAYGDDFVGDEAYEEVVRERVNEYYTHFTDIE